MKISFFFSKEAYKNLQQFLPKLMETEFIRLIGRCCVTFQESSLWKDFKENIKGSLYVLTLEPEYGIRITQLLLFCNKYWLFLASRSLLVALFFLPDTQITQ